MFSSRFRFLSLFLIAFGFTFLVEWTGLASDHPAPWNSPHFSMDPKALYSAASEVNPPSGTDIAVLDEEGVYSYDANGRLTHTGYMIYKVLTQKGVEGWDYVSVGWEPWHQERPVIRARVITPDYAVHELDPTTINVAPARQDEAKVYSDQRVVRAPLPAIAPGSVVERATVSASSPSFPGSGAVGLRFFGWVGVPVQHSLLEINLPSDCPVQYVVQNFPDLKPQRGEAQGRVKLAFEYGPMAPLEEAGDYLPTGELDYPAVLFSFGTSWQRMADEYAQVVEASVHASEVKPLVEKLTQGKSSRTEKEQAILSFLDGNIRYTGIEFGENNIVPHSAAETLAHKYGDCKDKALLLVSMLRAAGIPAYMALLNTDRGIGVLPDLPGMSMFNHAIVLAPGDPDQWIDPTDEYARMGQLPIVDQGQLALVVRAGTQTLVRTPEELSQANVLWERREIHLAENGPARVVETTQPRGGFESGYRRSYIDREDKKTHENLTNYMKSQYLAEKLDRLDRTDPSDLSHPFELVLESNKAKRGFTELDSAVAAIRLESIFSLLPDELQRREEPEDKAAEAGKPKKKRTIDYQLPEAFVREWQYKIIPPLGFQPAPLPQDVKLALGPTLLTEQFSADPDGVVHAQFRFDSVKRRLTVSEATELRNKVAEIEAAEAILINFQLRGKVLQKQGKMRESFQSYHDLIAQHPKEAVHHLQIAQALLEGGMGEAARDEARLAVKLEPDSALAERTLADILEYDLVGRKMRPGSDFAGAVVALRAAAKLDPEDKAIVGNLAALLEYDEEGSHYSPQAKLREAIAEFRKLSPEEVNRLGLQKSLAYALFYAGEFAEARKYAETLNPQPKLVIVACEAALNGSAAGIREANKRISNEAELKETLINAGHLLIALRKYSLGADLWEAGAAGDTAAQYMAWASVYRNARLHEEIQFRNDPKDTALKYLVVTVDPSETVGMLNAILSKNAQIVMKQLDPEAVKELVNQGRKLRRIWDRRNLVWDTTLDYRVQAADPKGEGNDAVGYREKLQVDEHQLVVFVVKENGQYKVLAQADQPDPVGLEVLDRLAAHDLDGARVLLDWVREEMHLSGGDDPLAGNIFPRFWTKGSNGDAHQMQLAAASLLVRLKGTAQRGVSILEEAKKSAKTDAERANINLALSDGYFRLDEYEKRLAVSSELAKQYPESGRAFISQLWSLLSLKRFDEAQSLTQQRLKRMPDDTDALDALVRIAVAQRDYRAAYSVAQRIVDLGKGDANRLNQLAWLTLYFEKSEGPDIGAALKSSDISQNNYAILHTLGCLYAEAGKTREAYDVLIKAMDLRHLDEPDADFWYAFGRIAEQYGEREIALADYAKVTKPKQALDLPESTYQLAQMRLKVLRNNPPGGPSARGVN